jgi:hypothetical protein
MFTPYQHEPIHGLSSIWVTVDHTTGTDAEPAPSVCFKTRVSDDSTDHTQSGITTEDYGPGADFEDVSKILPRSATTPTEHAPQIIQNSANVQLTVEPMSPYQSVLHREVETLFGTANHAPAAALAPPVCSMIHFRYDCGFQRLDLRFTRLP